MLDCWGIMSGKEKVYLDLNSGLKIAALYLLTPILFLGALTLGLLNMARNRKETCCEED